MASSSSANSQHQYPTYPTCNCGKPAPLRRSNTIANPGRRFLGCANWEKKETRCKYFFWVDPASREKELEEKNRELQMKLEYMEQMAQDLSKEKKKLKKKLMALEGKLISYKIWCAILIVACISLWFMRKNVMAPPNVKYLP